MDARGEVSRKKMLITIIAFFLALAGIIVFLFFNCLRLYSEYDVNHLDLTHEELTFEKYESRRDIGGWYFVIYSKEYKESFRLEKGVTQESLNKLKENNILKVTFCRNFHEICEISCNGIIVLSLSDYIQANKNNQIFGMVVWLLLFVNVLFFAWFFIRTFFPINDNKGLGRMRIEYTIKGNVIRVYHSINVCSLVINDQIFDQHRGVYGYYFCLKGRIGMMKAGGKTICVEAKMGLLHMRLYYDGKLVAKKFMAFG